MTKILFKRDVLTESLRVARSIKARYVEIFVERSFSLVRDQAGPGVLLSNKTMDSLTSQQRGRMVSRSRINRG